MADAKLGGQRRAGPVGDAMVLGWWRQGGGQDLSVPVAPGCLWGGRDGVGRPPAGEPSRAFRLRQASPSGGRCPVGQRSRCWRPFGGQQQEMALCDVQPSTQPSNHLRNGLLGLGAGGGAVAVLVLLA